MIRLLLAVLFMMLFSAPVFALDIGLQWRDNSDNEAGFILERKDGAGEYVEIAKTEANVTKFVDGGVPLNTTLCYRAKAFNAAGSSDYSNEACVSAFLPAAPSELGHDFGPEDL